MILVLIYSSVKGCNHSVTNVQTVFKQMEIFKQIRNTRTRSI